MSGAELKRRIQRLTPDQRALLAARLEAARGGAETDRTPAARLVAYVVPDQAGPSLVADQLRAFLRERVPEPMIPSSFVLLDELPRLPNGKVDAGALPAPSRGLGPPADSFVAPRDSLEQTIARVWAEVLKANHVSVHDDFFEIGGDSLLAVRLFERLERALGRELPLATLFAAPTVARLAQALRSQGWTPPWASLVAMQPRGSKAPLFCVHSYEGHVLFYNDLARHLAPDQPVYGLQAAGIDGRTAPRDRVEQMAASYLEEIRAIRPRGPYHFLGICFGIAVAFELAQQLRAQGEEVGELIMLDSGFLGRLPAPAPPAPTGPAQRVLRRLRGHAKGLRNRSLRTVEHLRASAGERTQRRLREASQTAWHRYQPRPYPGPVTLIRSAEYGAAQDWHVQTWSELAVAGLRTHLVPGGHLSILHEPYVAGLASCVRDCLSGQVPGD